MAVRFFGPVGNHSGYGVAVSNFAKAFSKSKINTKFNFASNENEDSFIKTLNNYSGNTDIDFYLHCPPYGRHSSKAYKIGYFYWEADRLPRNWGVSLHGVNELWVPCLLVKRACEMARFKGPIRIVPTPCEAWDVDEKLDFPSEFSDDYVIRDDIYKFYSIFQWHNRKGWKTLLTSYYNAFNEGDNVILILKVNPLNIGGYNHQSIMTDILSLKNKLNLKYYPPIYLSREIVPMRKIRALHNTADCYVSSHHGEGWGMPIHDAMRLGKQLIVTKYGGVTEFLDDTSANIIKHTVGPVSGMDWSPLYGKYQNWAHPSSRHLSELMRDLYNNHSDYSYKTSKAIEIANSMDIDHVAALINKELEGGR